MIDIQAQDKGSTCADRHEAPELNRSKWLVRARLPGQEAMRTMTVSGGSANGHLKALADIASVFTDGSGAS